MNESAGQSSGSNGVVATFFSMDYQGNTWNFHAFHATAGSHMVVQLALKLRVTAAALGCASHKDFCARFRAVNPATHFDFERSHKWLQGRALPRSAQVYEDWAKVLGTNQSGTWIAECTLEKFLAEAGNLHHVESDALLQRAEVSRKRSVPSIVKDGRAEHNVCGTYACYSHAWSPYFRGSLIRGALTICPSISGSGVVAIYTETLLGQIMRFEGEVLMSGRALHLILRPQSDVSLLFQTFIPPGPPASVLCGVMSGAIVVGHEPQPSTTRIVIVRVRNDASASNAYLQISPTVISSDLTELGVNISDPVNIDMLMNDFLFKKDTCAIDQIQASEQALLVAAFDKVFLTIGNGSSPGA